MKNEILKTLIGAIIIGVTYKIGKRHGYKEAIYGVEKAFSDVILEAYKKEIKAKES